jgi:putative hemolysin
LGVGSIYVRMIIFGMLLVFSAVFSSSETAIMGMSIAKIKQMEEIDEKNANTLKRLKKKLSNILITILIGNNLVNIAATAILTEITVEYFKEGNATLIATIVMTVLVLIFGEITPKTYAAQNPEKVAIRLGTFLEMLSIIFKPILILFNAFTNIIIKILGGEVNNRVPFVTEEEIRSLVDVGEEEGVVKHQEREMIDGIFQIDEIDVNDIMIPRIDMIIIEEKSSISKALDLIITYGHSRIPVYRERIDNIVGIIYAKDLLTAVSMEKEEADKIKILDLMRPAYYIPETKKVNELLKELQKQKVHMAIILDEYGGTEGLITIEDILEEIVGDIFDEYDDEENLIEKVKEDTYIVKAEIDLEEIEDMFRIEFPDEDDYGSLGGFVFNTLGRVPILGDKVEYKGLSMKVIRVSNRRIREVEIQVKSL